MATAGQRQRPRFASRWYPICCSALKPAAPLGATEILMTSPPSPPRSMFVLPLVILAFAGGILADRYGSLPGNTVRPPPGLGHTFDPFWEAWGLIDEHYVDRSAIQPVRMTRGAIQGLVASLGVFGHTTYGTPEPL